tara:strand:- start:2970 stop:3242 length:273 start_codon:yes stop_codon:yes gene_type:complete
VFKPLNRYILINPTKIETDTTESLIVLPDDYKAAEERYIEVAAIASAPDVRFDIKPDTKLVVDASMIEEISIGRTIYNIILDNYVVGMIS